MDAKLLRKLKTCAKALREYEDSHAYADDFPTANEFLEGVAPSDRQAALDIYEEKKAEYEEKSKRFANKLLVTINKAIQNLIAEEGKI